MQRLLFATNDGRSRYLSDALQALGHEVVVVDHDHIDLMSKGVAAVLSYSRPRMEWWQNYQMHPLVQQSRSRTLTANAAAAGGSFDGVILWGSWFAPQVPNENGGVTPYVFYVDQSWSLIPDLAEQQPVLPRRRSGHRAQRRAYEAARQVFAMSEWAVNQSLTAHAGLATDRVKWAGWGPCAFDLSSKPLAPDSTHPVVLHVGNDFHRKGADWFVATAQRVRRTRPDVRFVLVGKDQSGTHVDFGDAVEYLGLIDDKAKLTELFEQASLFLLPNRYDRSPHVLVEAMSAGLPLVVSLQGGPAELVADQQVGLGVRVGDVEGYAAAVIALLSDQNRRRQMGETGKQRVREVYNWRQVAERIMTAF